MKEDVRGRVVAYGQLGAVKLAERREGECDVVTSAGKCGWRAQR